MDDWKFPYGASLEIGIEGESLFTEDSAAVNSFLTPSTILRPVQTKRAIMRKTPSTWRYQEGGKYVREFTLVVTGTVVVEHQQDTHDSASFSAKGVGVIARRREYSF